MTLAPSLQTRPRRMKHWTTEGPDSDEGRLRNWWGVYTPTTIAARLQRTPSGVINKAKTLGLGAPGRGLWTMQTLVAKLGYCDRAIKNAAIRAGIPLVSRRQPTTTLLPDGTHARTSWWWGFDDDDMDAIVVELNGTPSGRVMSSRSGEWGTGRKSIACLACGTHERPHFARGMCRRCYSSALAHGEHDRHPVVRKRSQE